MEREDKVHDNHMAQDRPPYRQALFGRGCAVHGRVEEVEPLYQEPRDSLRTLALGISKRLVTCLAHMYSATGDYEGDRCSLSIHVMQTARSCSSWDSRGWHLGWTLSSKIRWLKVSCGMLGACFVRRIGSRRDNDLTSSGEGMRVV